MKDIPLDEMDGILSSPPENLEDLEAQIEYMRKHLKRPLPDKSIERTKEMLQWWWSWLHMRYRNSMKGTKVGGKTVYNLMKKREEEYRKIYYKKIGKNDE